MVTIISCFFLSVFHRKIIKHETFDVHTSSKITLKFESARMNTCTYPLCKLGRIRKYQDHPTKRKNDVHTIPEPR